MRTLLLLPIIIVSVTLTSCGEESPSEAKNTAVPEIENDTINTTPFILPPLEGVDVEYTEYSFAAENGDTIFHESGSILLFPPNSMLDVYGNVVTGDVTVSYREFSDPLDFFLSGVPMDYDSAGTNYVFESSAMCEVTAMQNGQELFVNPESQPEMNLVTSDLNAQHNLYYLNEETECWVNKGKDDITKVGEPEEKPTTKVAMPEAPVKPRKPSGDRPTFNLAIDPQSAPELSAYDQLVFEVHEDDKVYKASDGNELWDDIKIESANRKGAYNVTFFNSSRSVTYLTRPVFTGKDYEEALALFERKQKEYESLLNDRLQEETLAAAKIQENEERIKAKNNRTKKLNLLIEKRNKEIEEQNIEIAEKNKEIEEENKEIEKRTEERNKEIEERGKKWRKRNKEIEKRNEVIRSFKISGFGIWNCDNPNLRGMLPVYARFIDNNGDTLELYAVTVIHKSFNGVMAYKGHKISLSENRSTMIWSIEDDRFYYLPYSEYDKCEINSDVTEYTFTMTMHPEIIKSADDIRGILNL